jgi:O-antigen/teichoic acid export membrane protein
MPNFSPPPLAAKLFSGAIWTTCMRFAVRGVGFVSVLILVRILSPEDFGLVAIAHSISALSLVLIALGARTAVLQNKEPTAGHYDTAWCFGILQGVIVAGVVLLCLPWVVDFYGDPRLEPILAVIAFRIFISSLENIWVLSFQKEFKFRSDFSYMVVCRLMSFVATVTLAFVLKNYWALVLGQLVGEIIKVSYSYIVIRKYPKFRWPAARETWGFSQWYFIRGLGNYAFGRSDRLFVAKLFGLDATGVYAVVVDLCQIPHEVFVMPAIRALLPGLVMLRDTPERMGRAIVKIIAATATIAFPAYFGMAATAYLIFPVVFGPRWVVPPYLLEVFAMLFCVMSFSRQLQTVFVSMGKIRWLGLLCIVQGSAFLAIIYVTAGQFGVVGFGVIKIALSLAMLFSLTAIIWRITNIPMRDLVAAFLRPAIATTAMVTVIVSLRSQLINLPELVQLIVLIGVGALTYGVILTFLWFCAGRPESIERMVFERFLPSSLTSRFLD